MVYNILEILLHIAIVTIAYHLIREHFINCCIPLPFSNIFGYKYKITEKAGTILTSFALIMGSDNLVRKVKNVVEAIEKSLGVSSPTE